MRRAGAPVVAFWAALAGCSDSTTDNGAVADQGRGEGGAAEQDGRREPDGLEDAGTPGTPDAVGISVGSSKERLCDRLVQCEEQSDGAVSDRYERCVQHYEDDEAEARQGGCETDYQSLVDCLAFHTTCEDLQPDVCDAEREEYEICLRPPAAGDPCESRDWGVRFAGECQASAFCLSGSLETDGGADCSWTLPDPPLGDGVELDLVNIVVDDTYIPHVTAASECPQQPTGWHYDDAERPASLILCEATCAAIQGHRVLLELGCPQVRL